MKQCTDTYKEVRTFVYPNERVPNVHAIVKVYIPDLTEEEREKRMKNLHDAAASIILAHEKAKAKKRIEQGAMLAT